MAARIILISKLLTPIVNLPLVLICADYLSGANLTNFSTLLFSSLLLQAISAGASLKFFKIIRLGGWRYRSIRKASFVYQLRQVVLGLLVYLLMKFTVLVEGESSAIDQIVEACLFSLATPLVFCQRIYYSRIDKKLFFTFLASIIFSLPLSILLIVKLNMPAGVLGFFAVQVVFFNFVAYEKIRAKDLLRENFRLSGKVAPFFALEVIAALYGYIDQVILSVVVVPGLMADVTIIFRIVAYAVALLSIFSFVLHYNLSSERQMPMAGKIIARAFLISVIGGLSIYPIVYIIEEMNFIESRGYDDLFLLSVYFWVVVQTFASYTYSIVISHTRSFVVVSRMSFVMALSIPFLSLSALTENIAVTLIFKSLVQVICILIHIKYIREWQQKCS